MTGGEGLNRNRSPISSTGRGTYAKQEIHFNFDIGVFCRRCRRQGGNASAPGQPRDFAIMPWDSSPSDPAQLQLMKEAGLNISGFCAPKDLPRVLAAGLMCFVSDPRVNGYDWVKMPPDSELRKNVAAAVREVANNPAVLGFYLRDEPGADMMPGLGRVASLLVEAAPEKWPYVNLFPTYASHAQLGAPDYETYLRRFVESVHPPFISWDNYSLVEGEMRDRFYTNLELVRRQSLESKIPFWNIILANTLFN